jgi:hypothetical protein
MLGSTPIPQMMEGEKMVMICGYDMIVILSECVGPRLRIDRAQREMELNKFEV